MSVSSSDVLVSTKCDLWIGTVELTPGLNVHGDDRLGSGLHLAGLLCGVLLEALLTDTGVLGILLLVVGTEEVNIIIVIVLSVGGGLGGVDGELSRLGTVGSELLGGVTGERRELGLERGDVLVPAGGVGVLGDLRGRLQGLEGLDIGLGRTVAMKAVSEMLLRARLN
jgi:hypothetical protein